MYYETEIPSLTQILLHFVLLWICLTCLTGFLVDFFPEPKVEVTKELVYDCYNSMTLKMLDCGNVKSETMEAQVKMCAKNATRNIIWFGQSALVPIWAKYLEYVLVSVFFGVWPADLMLIESTSKWGRGPPLTDWMSCPASSGAL